MPPLPYKAVEGHSGKVAELLEAAAAAPSEQAQGLDQISLAMIQMDKITRLTAVSADQAAGDPGCLSSRAGQLLKSVLELRPLIYRRQDEDLALLMGPEQSSLRPVISNKVNCLPENAADF